MYLWWLQSVTLNVESCKISYSKLTSVFGGHLFIWVFELYYNPETKLYISHIFLKNKHIHNNT